MKYIIAKFQYNYIKFFCRIEHCSYGIRYAKSSILHQKSSKVVTISSTLPINRAMFSKTFNTLNFNFLFVKIMLFKNTKISEHCCSLSILPRLEHVFSTRILCNVRPRSPSLINFLVIEKWKIVK